MEYYPKTPDCEGYNTPDGIMCEQCEEERAKYFAGGRTVALSRGFKNFPTLTQSGYNKM